LTVHSSTVASTLLSVKIVYWRVDNWLTKDGMLFVNLITISTEMFRYRI
jgi:hypothetical protein